MPCNNCQKIISQVEADPRDEEEIIQPSPQPCIRNPNNYAPNILNINNDRNCLLICEEEIS